MAQIDMQRQLVTDAVRFSRNAADEERELGLPGGVGLYTTAFYNGLLLATRDPATAQELLAMIEGTIGTLAAPGQLNRVSGYQEEWLDHWQATRG